MAVHPLVSVVVSTYRREEVLCQTLAYLLKQNHPNREIIVIDQTSEHNPETEECLRNLVLSNSIRYYRLQRASLPLARNFGARKAYGEVVLFVDDDVIPDPDLIAKHLSAYQDPSIGGVAGRRTFLLDLQVEEQSGPIGMILHNGVHVTNFSASQGTDVEWASGCNMSFQKNLLEQVNGFEPRFLGTAVYEDVDLCFRIRNLGYRIVFVPEAQLIHLVMPAGGCGARRQDRRYFYSLIHNRLLFTWRNRFHLGTLIWTYLTSFLFLGALIKQKFPLQMVISLLLAFPHSFLSFIFSTFDKHKRI
jgi:GT2 family glycosyltransferase